MDSTFAPGRAKFLKMPPARQHKWLADMLRKGFLGYCGFQSAGLERFYLDYIACLNWMNEPVPVRPEDGQKNWEEWLSNRFHFHQQATGLGLGAEGFLSRPTVGDQLDSGPWQPRLDYWVGVENIRSAFNLGSLLRTVDALGLAGVILGSQCPSSNHNQVRKTAMGADLWVPIHQPEDYWEHMSVLESQGFSLIGVEKTTGSQLAVDYPWPKQAVLLLGNEEFGLSERALNQAKTFVHLPMYGRKNSLNVASAFAALGYQINLFPSA